MRNLRPIRLLTTDCKILAKTLTRRLAHGLGVILGDHQSHGFRDRSIASNAHTIRYICETAESQQHPIAVLQVELSKAFDKVSHSFLFALPNIAAWKID
uniref:Putative tick transposon n=1 Tax=Ixodes ricinus TaxID=34613 RepID=A0A6B0UI52_IXORI